MKRLIDFDALWELITDHDENCCANCDVVDDQCNENNDCPIWNSLEVPVDVRQIEYLKSAVETFDKYKEQPDDE